MKRLLRKTKQMTTGVFWGYLSVATKNPIRKKSFLLMSRFLFLRRGIEIVFNENIGSGLVLGHGRNINVNSRAVIGKNCVLFGGCTIGSVRSGPRKGVPCLGNRVVVGLNAFIGGGVCIGDDVLMSVFNSYSAVYDVVDEGGNALVIPSFDEKAFGRGLSILMSDSDRLRTLGKAAIEKTHSFDVSHLAEKWISLLKTATDSVGEVK